MKAALRDGNRVIHCDVSWPGHPAMPEKPRNCASILILPRAPLFAFTRDDVSVSWTQADGERSLEWRFHTGGGQTLR